MRAVDTANTDLDDASYDANLERCFERARAASPADERCMTYETRSQTEEKRWVVGRTHLIMEEHLPDPAVESDAIRPRPAGESPGDQYR